MKLEVGKYYRTKKGTKAKVLCTDLVSSDPRYSVITLHEGTISWLNSIGVDPYRGDMCETTLVAEWRDPIKVAGWVAVYEDGTTTYVCGSKEGCQKLFPAAVAYVEVNGEEVIK